MCTVSDIMTRKVLTVAAEADVEDAAWGLVLKGLSGAPVRDSSGKVIGILSKSDLVDSNRTPKGGGTVRDTMTPLVLTARASEPLRVAVRRMVDLAVHRLVVMDEQGDLVGILTPTDVLRGLLDGTIDGRDFAGSQ